MKNLIQAAVVGALATATLSQGANKVLQLGSAQASGDAGPSAAWAMPNQTGAMTVEFWLRLEPETQAQTQFGRPFNLRGCSCGGITFNAFAESSGGRLEIELGTIDTWRDSTFSLSAWHHFAYTWSSSRGEVRLYVDGALFGQRSVPIGSSIQICDRPSLRFGEQCGRGLVGAIDNVRYWSIERSVAQVVSDMSRQYTPSEAQSTPGLIGAWTFEDGTVSNSAGTTPQGSLVSGAVIVEEPLLPDCNGDGIVDYGQCRDGSLPDYNGNNIPDCCETAGPCVIGNYPVQWRVSEGGNGHWYQYRASGLPWLLADSQALSLGGYLACIASGLENDVVTRLGREVAWLGGYQDLAAPDYVEPAGGWRWVSGEPWTYTNWYLLDPSGPEPNNLGSEHVLITWSGGTSWNDMNGAHPNSSLIEWSADCNDDGIVDKGQILLNQLPDANDNGIPDGCEQPTCRDADLVLDGFINGLDLGIMLGQWGPNTPPTESDLNQDGSVDGVDLGLLLSYWGPCPY